MYLEGPYHGAGAGAGVIDFDYCGNIYVPHRRRYKEVITAKVFSLKIHTA